jgi:topoisomerase IV subunit A
MMLNQQNYEKMPITDFVHQAYLDYAMSVILERALPHISDGLKPVQRRIIFAMSELSLQNTAKPKKSARTVGDVLGKFHPHGDSACYEALVLMSQPFSSLYPLIEGHGNFGSVDDPKSFAAMRYTEAKLSSFCELLLDKIKEGTVSWQDNFDGTLKEPQFLSASVPHILLNATTGIAVSMACDIPSHNLADVCKACIKILQNPKITEEEIIDTIQAPDYPSKATIITKKEDLKSMYKTGKGSVCSRAVYEMEGTNIIIKHLPYQVSPAKISWQIGNLIQNKKLPMLDDIQDESDHKNPIRLRLHIKDKKEDADEIMQKLYSLCDLEKSYRVNMNMIGINNKPQVKPLFIILKEWLAWRTNIVKNHNEYKYNKITAKLHILDGLLIAFLNLDEIIKIIRFEDSPKDILIVKFSLSSQQADAILESKLRNLAKLEQVKIKAEYDILKKKQQNIKKILENKKNLKKEVIKELKTAIKKYPNPRISPLVEMKKAQSVSLEKILPVCDVTVILSKQGWIRVARGHNIDCAKLKQKQSDELFKTIQMHSNQRLVLIDDHGRSYTISTTKLPSARGLGEPASSKIKLPDGAKIIDMLAEQEKPQKILLATTCGHGFMVEFDNLYSRKTVGKQIIKINKDCKILPPIMVQDEKVQKIVSITSEGYMLCFSLNELPILCNAKGVKIINIPKKMKVTQKEHLSVLNIYNETDKIKIIAGRRKFTLSDTDVKNFTSKRALRGRKLPRGLCKVDKISVIKDSKNTKLK